MGAKVPYNYLRLFINKDNRLNNPLFSFRPTALLSLMLLLFNTSNAQLVDGVLGQKRTVVQVLLRPFRIIEYDKDRVVRFIDTGIHQTVLFENDTCVKFYWAVDADGMDAFKSRLMEAGYVADANGFKKDSLELTLKPLASGKSTLFIASISPGLEGARDASGKLVVVRNNRFVENEPVPLLQQAILAEEKDKRAGKKPKEPKNPKQHWVGEKEGTVRVLGWEK